MDIISILKKLPIDLGQAEIKHSSKGKLIGFNHIRKVDSGRALDIGCRDGYWTRQLERKGYNVNSIDIEPHYEPALQVDVNDGLPFKDNQFDIIWCTEVIEHLKDPKESIKEMLRVSKVGGKIIITTPNSYFWLGRLLCLFGQSPAKIQNQDHKHFFDSFLLRKALPYKSKIYGFFPYTIFKYKISNLVDLLSPTFTIIIEVK